MDDWSFAKGIHELGIGFFAHLQVSSAKACLWLCSKNNGDG